MASGAGSTKAHSPIPMGLIGIVLLLFFGLASILHIQTSEAFFLQGQTVGLVANWGILYQPIALFKGQLAPRMAEAAMWGWGVELMYLVCVVGLEVAHEFVKSISPGIAKLFRFGMIAILILDGYSDFQFGNIASGFWGQLGFALITAFVVFFFGTIGWRFVESAVRELIA